MKITPTYERSHGLMSPPSSLIFDTDMSASKANARMGLVREALAILKISAKVSRSQTNQGFNIIITPIDYIEPNDLQLALRPIIRKIRFG